MATTFKRILVGVDDSADALLAFDYAIHQAKRDQAELIIVSVLEHDDMNVYQALDSDYVHGERDELRDHVKSYQKQAQDAGVTDVKLVIAEGEPGETIVRDVIPHVQPDLLVIGSIAKKGVSRYFGSQAAYMAKYAPISVMVVR
ncbi:MAG: universal stress protein [Levilactobacillus sp.]|jgi:nucleotide-binding universal stress UspA family protein|uniref:Universal stress protein n=1 Tax=Levilactobacillus suantsaiihabitans TaxID=2487722 RepID=A0A4Z0JAZ4_9LACO|nr:MULTISPECIES: universal stress protein [Levilactobacillus]MCI1552966.1 universal stress protein [Levilactobacillus sp.]MCI1598107.1 universal stress protein [Levilactobacillus sp.]MCI1606867.1 universal stress protein [Levilactobacillus sp.]TGD19969.1 universal stress protein [Levilactobacillus suantsaiihabitans]